MAIPIFDKVSEILSLFERHWKKKTEYLSDFVLKTRICGLPTENISNPREDKNTRSATYQGAVHVEEIGLMKRKLEIQVNNKNNLQLCMVSKL